MTGAHRSFCHAPLRAWRATSCVIALSRFGAILIETMSTANATTRRINRLHPAFVFTIVVCGLAAIMSSRISAECIGLHESLAERVARTSLVFVGDVLSIENVLEPESYHYRVRFHIRESFKGIGKGEQVVQFGPATVEDFKFQVGERVLVYAAGRPGSYSTQCTATGVIASKEAEIQALRRLRTK
jgi:hypothetical protein